MSMPCSDDVGIAARKTELHNAVLAKEFSAIFSHDFGEVPSVIFISLYVEDCDTINQCWEDLCLPIKGFLAKAEPARHLS